LRIFLYAPLEEKVNRLIARGKSESEALELAETIDRDRVEYVQKYFHVEWPSRAIYHLMINTEIGDEAVVQTVLKFMETVKH
jgi:cytidylate kinase